jgi:site-specific recombinase XerD
MTEQVSETLGRLLQDFFCRRLMDQLRASPQTVKSYRDSFRLLLRFAERKLGKQVTKLSLMDLDASLILAFLDHLETERSNKVRSRNARLAAIRSFLHYAGLKEPSALPTIQRVFAIPMKRFDQPALTYLSLEEIENILSAPDRNTWSGRRDRALLAVMYNTGARVSEIVALKCMDIENKQCGALLLHGKGRKERVIPVWKRTGTTLQHWLSQIDQQPQSPLFPNRYGNAMTRSGVERQLQSAVAMACERCPSIRDKKVSPHTIRHTTAMHLLQAGVDLSVIALWLGHENITTTHAYMQADIEMKRRALDKMKEPQNVTVRFKPSKEVFAFLDSL